MNLKTIVGHVGGRCKGEYEDQRAWESTPATSGEIKGKIDDHLSALLDFIEKDNDKRSLDEVERELRGLLFAQGRLLLAYFLARREESSQNQKDVARWQAQGYRRKKPQRKHLNTFFGRVTFWRTYVRLPGGSGLHPLDFALGLTADGFSLLAAEMCARLSTLVSYEQVTALMLYFLSWSPSKTTVEKAVLGFGRQTQEWFEQASPPEGDGEVLVIQIDSKATPTATEEELEKRRGKRDKKKPAPSPRQRGRQKRSRRQKKRRKKGDKSKNGKAATIVVMYTLKQGRDDKGKEILLGPINKRVYASYAPKKHAFAVARREADKRGFPRGSNKTVQLVTDGDVDLACYATELFPGVEHTIDIYHVLEYLWEAGRMFQPEGSKELAKWVKIQEGLLFRGKAEAVVENVAAIWHLVSPAQKKRVEEIREYLAKRTQLMQYGRLRRKDLEIGSGMVEGAVKHVIGKRFDNGSMRWIRERAEALLQLRCIEINGQWSAFVAFAHRRLEESAQRGAEAVRLLTATPSALPSVAVSVDKNAA